MSRRRRHFLPSTGAVFALSSALALSACGGDGATEGEAPAGGDATETVPAWVPEEPITMISAFGAGGGTDKVARAMLAGIEDCEEGVTGNVEYREGGSGVVGYTYFMQQEGDPHQVMASTTELTTLPLFVDTQFTWETFTPIAQIADDQVSIVVPGDSPFNTLQDLIEEAKTRPVTVGVVGISGPDNIVRVLLEEQAGVTFEPVVFGSGGETTAAILGGDVDAALGGAGDIVGQLESGDAKALAVFGDSRYEEGVLAEVPTAQEQGFDISFAQWRGLLGTPGMPEEAGEFYANCLEQWVETDSYGEYIDTSLALPAFRRGEEFRQFLAEQEETIRRVLDK